MHYDPDWRTNDKAGYLARFKLNSQIGSTAVSLFGGRLTWFKQWLIVSGNTQLPYIGDTGGFQAIALTVGGYIFLAGERVGAGTQNAILSHEYIHMLQYAADPGFILDYLLNKKTSQKYEAIAYLWQAWGENFAAYDGDQVYSYNVDSWDYLNYGQTFAPPGLWEACGSDCTYPQAS